MTYSVTSALVVVFLERGVDGKTLHGIRNARYGGARPPCSTNRRPARRSRRDIHAVARRPGHIADDHAIFADPWRLPRGFARVGTPSMARRSTFSGFASASGSSTGNKFHHFLFERPDVVTVLAERPAWGSPGRGIRPAWCLRAPSVHLVDHHRVGSRPGARTRQGARRTHQAVAPVHYEAEHRSLIHAACV